MRFHTLGEWLAWQEHLHPRPIDLGLERVARVAQGLDLLRPACPVVTVAGTNGKGSTVAMLEAVYRAAGFTTGVFTSPHLLRYNERIRLNGVAVDDAPLCEAFAQVDAARGEETLSYFEFGTLAALWLFRQAGVDVMVLEVGLGGRLDAVNIVDADVAIVASVGLDHQQWLGEDRECIGAEKAGIFRPGRPAVCGDPEPPASVAAAARALGARWWQLGEDFRWTRQSSDTWTWQSSNGLTWEDLPLPALDGEVQLNNASCALAAVSQLSERLPVNRSHLLRGLREVRLAGRFQKVRRRPDVIVDVAHNPLAAQALAGHLARNPVPGRTLAVVAMMADKDVDGVIGAIDAQVDLWFVGGLPEVARAATADVLGKRVLACTGRQALVEDELAEAYAAALEEARPDDRIIVFGSFHTVAKVLEVEHVT
jgi:dihydrofolate synthase / folylpolyglutamate synthase